MKNITSSPRFYLKEFKVSDAIHFYNLNKNPEVIKYTRDSPFKSLSDTKKFILNHCTYNEYVYGSWAVCLK